MRSHGGNPFITWGFGLILFAIGFQLLWNILQQYKLALGIGLILICCVLAIRRFKRHRGYGDDLIIR